MRLQTIEDGLEHKSLPLKRWESITLLWRNAGLDDMTLPPLSQEDIPLGFTIVHPGMLRNACLACETGDPLQINRSLRGSPRGAINFEVDYRRHFSPPLPDPDPNPCPAEASFLAGPQPPLYRKDVAPTVPWGRQADGKLPAPPLPPGMVPAPAPPNTVPVALDVQEEYPPKKNKSHWRSMMGPKYLG